MRLAWAVLLGVVGGVVVAWWLSRDTPAEAQAKEARAQRAAAMRADEARGWLYRWHDDAGTVHVTQKAPKGRKFQRIPSSPDAAIEVHGAPN